MLVAVAASRGGGGGVEEFADLGPGEFLIAGVVDGNGQEPFGLGDEAGQGVQPDAGVAEPGGRAQPGEVVDRLKIFSPADRNTADRNAWASMAVSVASGSSW